MNKAISYTLVFLGIQLIASVLVTTVMNIFANDEQLLQSPYVKILVMVLFSLTTAIVFISLHWASPTRTYLMSRPWLTALWVIVAAIGTIIPAIAFEEMLPQLPNLVEEDLNDIMNARGGYFVVCLLVPVVEELVFRGAVLRALLQWKSDRHWVMIAVSALLFSVAHMNPAQMPHAFIIGLLLGWLYYRSHSIVPGVIFHWVNNTVAYFLFKFYPDPDTRLIDILGSQQRVLFAVLFSLLILLPALYQLHLRMHSTKE